MLVIIRSAPDTPEGRRGVKIAAGMNADLVLLQNGVGFVHKGLLEGFIGTAYVLEDDVKLRGIKEFDADKRLETINYDSLVDLMTESDKVVGMF